MRNRMIIILAVIALLFVGLYFAVQAKNKSKIETSGNPFEKDNLHPATIEQLDDPLYQNQITPTRLASELEKDEGLTVYFYDPLCKHCLRTTPILVPVAESLDVEVKKMNLREFPDEWQKYDIEGTPSLIHYKNGEEVSRLAGAHEEEDYEEFFKEHVLDDN